MVKENYERKLEAINRALSAAQSSAAQGRYASAFNEMKHAKSMIPKEEDYAGTAMESFYEGAKTKMDILTKTILGDAQREISDGYQKVNDEMERISRGGKASPAARRAIKDIEGQVGYFTGPGMPTDIAEEFGHHKERVEDLKKELEALAKSKGKTVDWNAK
ncbi:MAG: hypothetical protein HYS53_02635 [Candidatus Aenigmarchaeota archaeon]|nr:hypothetical protein [Candidatus Aenigmarchaeota archaeon]